MHSTNNTRGYVDALMTQEASPPFSEVRELVMNYSGRRKWAYLARPLVEGVLVAALLIAAVMYSPTVSHITTKASAPPMTASIIAKALSTPMAPAYSAKIHSILLPVKSGDLANKMTMESAGRTIAPVPSTDSIVTSESLGTNRPIPEKITTLEATSEVPAMIPIASSHMEGDRGRWVAFISGGYGIVPAGSATFTQSLFGSIGLRYGLSGPSSFVLEARRTSFPISHASQNSTLRDTTLSLDGTSYRNTIGKILTQTTHSTNDVATIDAGYRFEWQASNRWSPFAAVFLGANTSGMISSASLGLRFRLGASYLCDVSARADQFVSPGALPERAFEMEAGIGFAW